MMQRVIAIFIRHIYLLRRSPHRMIGMLYWPTMELFLWGFLTLYLNRIGAAEFNFVTVLLSALIFWDFFNRSQQALSVSFLEDVWVRNVGNVLASPIRPVEYLFGLILVSIFQTIVSLSFIASLAYVFWQLNLFQFGFWLLPFFANLYITGWAMGIFATALILRLGPSTDVLAWSLPLLLQPLSAVFYPVTVLPGWLQTVAHWLPTTYIFEGMRAIIFSQEFIATDVVRAFLLNLVYISLAIFGFALSYRSVRRRGTLQRYSD